MSSLPKLESTSHADWSRTNFTTQPPRGVWGYAASASPSTPFQTASRYRGQGGVSSTKSHLAPRSSLLSVQKCSAHGIDAALPQPSNWLAWPKRSLKPPNANDSDQPEPTVRGLAPGGRCWPGVSFRAFAVKQPLKSCSLVHDKGSTTVSLLQISVCSEISNASSTSMPRYRMVDSSLECPSSN